MYDIYLLRTATTALESVNSNFSALKSTENIFVGFLRILTVNKVTLIIKKNDSTSDQLFHIRRLKQIIWDLCSLVPCLLCSSTLKYEDN